MPDFQFNPSPIPQLLQVAAVFAAGTTPPFSVSRLHFDWEVNKNMGSEPDDAIVNIYNLAPVHREQLVLHMANAYGAASFATAISVPEFAGTGLQAIPDPEPALNDMGLFVGWQGRAELLFSGSLTRLEPEVFMGPDTVTRLTLADGGINMRDATVAGGEVFGQLAQLGVASRAGELGYTVSDQLFQAVARRAAELPLKSWQEVNTRDPRLALNDIMATLGLKWSVVGNRMVAYDAGVRDDVAPLRLTTALLPNNATNGLLDWTRLDDGGYTIRALGTSSAVVGQRLICVDDKGMALGLGQLRIQSLRFRGNNDGEHLMEIEARKVDLIGAGPATGFV